VRGLGYVGAADLLTFIFSAAVQITRLESGHAPSSSLAGWPLVLLIVGVVALAASALLAERASSSRE
jgi:hypothetical protein